MRNPVLHQRSKTPVHCSELPLLNILIILNALCVPEASSCWSCCSREKCRTQTRYSIVCNKFPLQPSKTISRIRCSCSVNKERRSSMGVSRSRQLFAAISLPTNADAFSSFVVDSGTGGGLPTSAIAFI